MENPFRILSIDGGGIRVHKFLELSDLSLTTPMHTNRKKLLGYDAEVIRRE